tara:strand:+ start:464 stop:886 length:423 start_codon:yes stop_codon:yes gene_type:complete
MQESLLVYDLTEIGKVSKIVTNYVKQYNKLLFSGPLGSGKTTLIKSIINELGYNDNVSSPTFSLINEYPVNDKMIYHIDLYRINKVDELYEIGFDEYLGNGNLCLIEWPKIAMNMIDKDFVHIKLKEISKTKRSIEIKSI